ncbi:MAG TPA: glycosyltransferase [Anaeromyxobacteraceae bacterium]|nr:glycosyltransferase [Anaeromyxobacteraceae bacterium]
MRIALVDVHARLPASGYGGVERILWWLGRELTRRGHEVSFVVAEGHCPFAAVIAFDGSRPLAAQLPRGTDVVHFHHALRWALRDGEDPGAPHLVTLHGTGASEHELDRDTVFISESQAARHGSRCVVHNGIDWSDYPAPDLDAPRSWVHFLGDGAWRVKNLRGAIDVARRAGETLHVGGGFRLNFRMGFRLTLSPRVRFHGWVGGEEKWRLLRGSRGLVFPVRWQEPFGLAIVESLWFGCPVFGTPYGSLPELVPPEVGVLSTSAAELAEAVRQAARIDRRACHAQAARFGVGAMVDGYLLAYEKVRAGEHLHAAPPRRVGPREPKLLPWS